MDKKIDVQKDRRKKRQMDKYKDIKLEKQCGLDKF